MPNPSDGRFSVEYQSSGNTNDRITIYDITGRIMLTREITGYNKESKVKFNLSGFPEGLYMLEINSGGRISTRKLLIR
ncbi:MAG: T9SS type A sorting domain-containing protein [Bacteroidia bacterium]|nr:T9SS type A sorting domain-containing protein [Bacteroidia bacterium]